MKIGGIYTAVRKAVQNLMTKEKDNSVRKVAFHFLRGPVDLVNNPPKVAFQVFSQESREAKRVITDLEKHVRQFCSEDLSLKEIGIQILQCIKGSSLNKEVFRHDLGVELVRNYGVESCDAFTLIDLKRDSLLWDMLADPGNWTPERRILHSSIKDQRLKSIIRLSTEVTSNSQVRPNTWIAQRGSSGSGKTTSLRNMFPNLSDYFFNGVINPDLVKSQLMSLPEMLGKDGLSMSTHLGHHYEGSQLMYQTAQHVKTLTSHLLIEDTRLADLSAIHSLFDTARATSRTVHINDHHASIEQAFLTILRRLPGGKDPVVPWKAFEKGVVGSAKTRPELVSRLGEPVIVGYKLFAFNAGNQKLVVDMKNGKLNIVDQKSYQEIQAHSSSVEEEVAEFANTPLSINSINTILKNSSEKFYEIDHNNLTMYIGLTPKEIMNKRSQLRPSTA